MLNPCVRRALAGFMDNPGLYVSVDGQFGSTGKGVINGLMAEMYWPRVNSVLSNAGPNSGHTNYVDDEKIVLKQLPTFGVTAHRLRRQSQDALFRFQPPDIGLTAGAVIDSDILMKEVAAHGIEWQHLSVHPNAAVITGQEKQDDAANVSAIASTGQGVGPAIINKMKRKPDGVFGRHNFGLSEAPSWVKRPRVFKSDVTYMEVSQGFSLGINSGFYPHTTTRECTVSQALSDAGLPPSWFRKSIMSVRTYPIRVGSTEGSSGPYYADQQETSWEALGQEPEYTTVTKRVRRVFTWSHTQFCEAVKANDPEVIFLNFVNHLRPDEVDTFVRRNILQAYSQVGKTQYPTLLLGYGPKSSDVYAWEK